MKKKRFTMIDEMDYANVLTQWSNALNMHSQMFESRVICNQPHPFSYELKHDWDLNNLKHIQIEEICNWVMGTDYIILGDTLFRSYNPDQIIEQFFARFRNKGLLQSDLHKIISKVQIIVWHPGTVFRTNYRQFNIWLKNIKRLYCQDLYRLSPKTDKDLVCLPTLIKYETDRDKICKMIHNRVNNDKLLIIHSPSNRKSKGSDIIAKVVKNVISKYPNFEYKELHKVSNVEVMEWKKRAVINIDQFNTTVGNFGITSIEGLINGNIVLSTYNHVNLIDISKNYDKIGKKSLVECPIIDISKSVNYFTIKLEEVCKMTKEELIKISIESYDYYIEYMSPSVVAKFFETNLV